MPSGNLENEASEPTGAGGRLRAFRERFYASFGRHTDALFELTDAILTASPIPSLPHLSLASVHRRSWCRLYAALGKGRIDPEALKGLLSLGHLRGRGTRVYAVDVSPWPRCDAESSPGRCYLYHPSKHSAGQPISSPDGRVWEPRVVV
jgi:hypothetical protein